MVKRLSDAVGISDILSLIRGAGENIGPTPSETAQLIALARSVANDNALWSRLPADIRGESTARLRAELRAYLAA